MKFEYLLFNLIIALFPTLGVLLYPNARWPKIVPALKSILWVSIPYLVWDHIVTNHWWTFHSRYTLGLKLGKLPIEEVLFFFIIPWSCLVIWENLKLRVEGKWNIPVELFISLASLAGGLFSFLQHWRYSVAVCGVLLLMSTFSLVQHEWLRQKNATLFLAIVSVLTLIFNGYLTARPVVMYSPQVMSNLRVGTIPVEDFFYGLALLSGITMIYSHYEHSTHTHTKNRSSSLV